MPNLDLEYKCINYVHKRQIYMVQVMFAGRYMWWLLTSAAIFLIILLGFDAVAWFIVSTSNCASREGSCYILSVWLLADIKPQLSIAAGAIVVAVVMIRVVYLRFNPLWALAFLIWAVGMGLALGDYVPLWHGETVMADLLLAMPPYSWAALAFCLFLCFPMEEEDMPETGNAAPLGWFASVPALVMTAQAAVGASSLPQIIVDQTGMVGIAQGLLKFQHALAGPLKADGSSYIVPMIVAVAFVLSLGVRIYQHEQLVGNLS